MYATVEELEAWLGDTPPAGSERMLARASRYMDNVLLKTSIYPVDDAGTPTEEAHITAMRDACCATVEWWQANGDDGLGAGSEYTSVTAGSISLSKPSRTDPTGGAVDPRRAPEAVEILDGAGLLGHSPRTYQCRE
ncbi:hypothetical protein [Streptosporangium sp. NPDC049078]|uniref:hypothetical protein n=1 Tax=Streptosporangium sp. NPDC049078 TaxID=3155767 RepID=UPI00343675D7